MPLTSAYLLPHPPIMLPEVGRGEEQKIAATAAAYDEAARGIAAQSPRTIVIISPHAPAYRDFIELAGGDDIKGDMARFNAPQVRIAATLDTAFTGALNSGAEREGLPIGVLNPGKNSGLDHGALIPLYYIKKYCKGYKVVLSGISGLSPEIHRKFGELIAKTADGFPGNTVLIASGDLSHRLLAEGPYGFHPDGPKFDEWVIKTLKANDFGAFLRPDETLCENAGECGLRPLQVMAGAIGDRAAEARVISHEGPFGVGYGIAEIKIEN